jgi:acyl dehydratase
VKAVRSHGYDEKFKVGKTIPKDLCHCIPNADAASQFAHMNNNHQIAHADPISTEALSDPYSPFTHRILEDRVTEQEFNSYLSEPYS